MVCEVFVSFARRQGCHCSRNLYISVDGIRFFVKLKCKTNTKILSLVTKCDEQNIIYDVSYCA